MSALAPLPQAGLCPICGLREDLSTAEDRIRDLERQLGQIRATIEETAVSKADEAVRVHVENDPHIYADGSMS